MFCNKFNPLESKHLRKIRTELQVSNTPGRISSCTNPRPIPKDLGHRTPLRVGPKLDLSQYMRNNVKWSFKQNNMETYGNNLITNQEIVIRLVSVIKKNAKPISSSKTIQAIDVCRYLWLLKILSISNQNCHCLSIWNNSRESRARRQKDLKKA